MADSMETAENKAPGAPVLPRFLFQDAREPRIPPFSSTELERIINRALEKNGDLRYQDASELRSDFHNPVATCSHL
jgi:hypothetical protein